jgi:hypothetical protein
MLTVKPMKLSPEKKYPLLAILLLLGFFSFGAVPVGLSSPKNNPGLAEIFISPKGNDKNPGTKESPLKSLEKAREMARFTRKSSPEGALTIFVEDGTYLLERSIEFSAEDSGDEKHPFVIKASDNAKPVFKGGRLLKNWSLLKNTEKLKVLQGEAKGKIFVSNVKEAGITNYGDPIEPGKRPELFCNGQLQTLARWPNIGFTKAGSIHGATEMPPTYLKKRGTREGVFGYLDGRQKNWAAEKDGCVGGYWYFDWSDEFHKISKVDTVSKILFLAEPYHLYGYKDSLRYFGVNLFCEIDQPGEWYLDRTDGLLYWYPPVGVNPGEAEVSLSLFDKPFMLEIKECSYLTLQGLTFVESRGSALSISGGKNCLIRDCRMERLGRDGIHIDGGSGHGISGCLIRTLGYSGIGLKGGDRKNLTPANHFVENTIVEHFSMFKRTYEPAIFLVGCGMRVSNNRFRYSSSSAMRVEGNDFTIEYNEISHVVNESDDQGALDMWYDPSFRGIMIRYNRWSDISGGTHSGAAGVRLDDMISGATIYGNIFERCGARHFGGVQIHGGKDNLVENNLFYKCNGAVSFSLWGEKRWLEQLDTPVITQKIYNDVDIRSSLYTNKYPELKTIREKADFNTVKNNLVVDCLNQFLRNNDQQIFDNNPVLLSEGKGTEAFCTPETLRKHGLQPIPLQKMGPKNNQWDKK